MAFQIPLPQQEVILPVTGKTVRVQALTVKEKLAIVESEILTMSERLKFITQLTYEKIVDKEEYPNLQTFASNIYESDLNALVFGIMQATYRKPYTFRVICEQCGFMNIIEKPIGDTILEMSVNHGGQDRFFNDLHHVIDDATGLKFVLRLPSINDLIKAFKFAEDNDINILKESVKADNINALILKMAPYLLLPALVSIELPDGNALKNDMSKASMKNILEFLMQLTEETLALPHEKLEELRSKYKITTGFKYICQNEQCESNQKKQPITFTYDVLSEFFPIPVERLLS